MFLNIIRSSVLDLNGVIRSLYSCAVIQLGVDGDRVLAFARDFKGDALTAAALQLPAIVIHIGDRGGIAVRRVGAPSAGIVCLHKAVGFHSDRVLQVAVHYSRSAAPVFVLESHGAGRIMPRGLVGAVHSDRHILHAGRTGLDPLGRQLQVAAANHDLAVGVDRRTIVISGPVNIPAVEDIAFRQRGLDRSIRRGSHGDFLIPQQLRLAVRDRVAAQIRRQLAPVIGDLIAVGILSQLHQQIVRKDLVIIIISIPVLVSPRFRYGVIPAQIIMTKIVPTDRNRNDRRIISICVRGDGGRIIVFDDTAIPVVAAHDPVGGEVISLCHFNLKAVGNRLTDVRGIAVIKRSLRVHLIPCISNIFDTRRHSDQGSVGNFFLVRLPPAALVLVKAPIDGPPVAPVVIPIVLLDLLLKRPGVGPVIAAVVVGVLFMATNHLVTTEFYGMMTANGVLICIGSLVIPAAKPIFLAVCTRNMLPSCTNSMPSFIPFPMRRIVVTGTPYRLRWIAAVVMYMLTDQLIARVRVRVFLSLTCELAPLCHRTDPFRPRRNVRRQLRVRIVFRGIDVTDLIPIGRKRRHGEQGDDHAQRHYRCQ